LVWFGFDFDFAASCCRNRKWGTLIRPPGDAETAMLWLRLGVLVGRQPWEKRTYAFFARHPAAAKFDKL
jgi:hypothetical protein